MTTIKQQAANQQNALLSTGPRTDEGKSTSSRNATRHGIFSEEIVITKGEVQEKEIEFKELADELRHDLKPEGQMESLLVEKIAVNYWRLRRLLRYETGEVRQLLDKYIREYIESSDDDDYASFSNNQQKPPRCNYYSIEDQFTSEQFHQQKIRVEALRSDDFDYCADSETIDYVLTNRLRKDAEKATNKDREQAIAYLQKLSPQQKGKIKRDILALAEEQYEEMQQINNWQRQLEIVKLIRSIPVAGDLTKVIKYEGSLERSIFKNLAMLKTLQNERKKI